MELYCGGNNIEGVREVGHLRGLQKLIILDLSGNPMTSHEDYRLYTVYHLRKLKVKHNRKQTSQWTSLQPMTAHEDSCL